MNENTEIELEFTGGPDLEKRFNVVVNGKSAGELQMSREAATRVADLLFGGNYKVIRN